MSQHIIKCKTILKINEIETINLTLGLNFLGERQGDRSVCKRAQGWGSWRGRSPQHMGDSQEDSLPCPPKELNFSATLQ